MLVILTLLCWLTIASLNTKAYATKQPKVCNGGFCLPKHLCPNGIIEEHRPQQNGLVTINVYEYNECGDFMKRCCIGSAIPENYVNHENTTEITDVQCGISNTSSLVYNVHSSITYAKYGEFPWTVAFFNISLSANQTHLTYVGGGSLIHPKFVVTVGHSLSKLDQHVARFGEWNIESDAEIYPSQDIKVKELILHPSYVDYSIPINNIALAVLERNVIYTEHIRPICLPDPQDIFNGQQCIASGWGKDVISLRMPPILKRVELPIVEQERCFELLLDADEYKDFLLHDGEICAGGEFDKDMCEKDGGSPLACPRKDGSYVLAGITSWGVGCGRPKTPGVYVNVAYYSSWINETIESYGKLPGDPDTLPEQQETQG